MEGDRRQLATSQAAIGGAHHDHIYFSTICRRLRWQLLVAYLTPLVLLSVYFHFEYNTMLREGIDNHLRSVAENRRNTVDLFLQERVANVKGVLRIDVPVPPPADLMDGALDELRRESATFVDLGLFSPQGTLVAYAGPHPSLVGKDYSGETWFRRLMEAERDHFISDVYRGFRDRPHFIVAVRRIIDGQPWAIRVSVDPERFGSFVKRSYLIEDAEAFILNSQARRQTFSGAAVEDPVACKLPPRSPDTRVEEVALQGRRYLRAISWLTETSWALVVRVPRDKAYVPLRHARLVLIALSLVAIGMILFIVLRSTRKLVGRLEAAYEAKESLRFQLFDAAKLASVGEMAAGVAHEINNPLAIIYEEASMMKDIMDPQFRQKVDLDDFQERLDAITQATMRGRSITSKLLAFARRHDPDPEPSDVNMLLDRVIEVKKVDFSVSNIEVVKDYDPDLPQVMINRNQMDQVVLNLFNNAKDAIEGEGRIVLRTRVAESTVRIDVEDSGVGMPPEILDRVFFPFFTTKGVGKGTGLGLSISYGIVEAHGGRIEVRSKPGEGTIFSIFLPLQQKKQNGQNHAEQEDPQRQT